MHAPVGIAALALLVVILGGAPGAALAMEARLADAVLAEIGSSPVMLSDVALARALGTFGLEPSAGPVTEVELAHYLDAQLAAREAAQIGVDVPAADVDREWQAAGGAALTSRLAAAGIDAAWARRLVEDNLRVEHFVDRRFRAFAFVSEFDVDAALGAGDHDEAARARTRDRLREEMVARALADWTKDARQRSALRRIGPPGPWPAPFSLDPRSGGR